MHEADHCAYTSFFPFSVGLIVKCQATPQMVFNTDVLKYSADKPKKKKKKHFNKLKTTGCKGE